MANTVAGPAVTENQEKDGGSEAVLDIEEYKQEVDKLFVGIIRKIDALPDKVNTIERALVTNISSDISIVKELVVEFCTQKYMRQHVKDKVECIGKEVDGVIKYLEDKRKEKKKEEGGKNGKEIEEVKQAGTGKTEEKKTEAENQKTAKKLFKTSEWLIAIAKKTEKIKKLVSQFGSLPDEDEAGALSSTSKTQKQKTLSDTTECHYMCIEESLLISPMMASLKKSYDHLPSELRFCLLSLAAFPENFIIKKRPLIYWWMAEGFVVTKLNSKSAEEVGQQNFSQLIQLGLIQPWYEGKINKPNVQGCKVHPWIRRMLVSIAMEAQLLEFFNRRFIDTPPRSPRVCLYDDGEGEGIDHIATWKTRNRRYDKFRSERLKWLKAQSFLEKNKKEKHDTEFSKMPEDLNEVSDRQTKLRSTFEKSIKCLTDLNNLLADVSHEKMKPWSNHDAFNQRLNNLMTRIQLAQNDVGNNGDGQNKMQNILNELHGEQMELLNDIEGLHKQVQDRVNSLVRLLDPEVYERSKSCETLQNSEQLFLYNDLNKQFPFPMKRRTTSFRSNEQIPSPMKKRTSDVVSNDDDDAHHAEKLLAIINVSQSYLDMEQEWFGKLKRLRTLHLGRWRDSFPIPHIEVENTRFLEALFRVAKHLKYLSLRGISRITELPPSISRCCNLQILDLKACYNLEKLPNEIASLSKLTHFDVSECYLLQNTNLWSLVQNLGFLQTLKGLKVDEFSHNSLKDLTSGNLRKLSIILTTTSLEIDLSSNFMSNLRVLTITWRTVSQSSENPQQPKQGKSDGGASTENPPQQHPEKSDGGASTENPPQQQPEKSDGGASTENPPQQQPEKIEGGASTENPPKQQPEKSDGGANTENPPQEQPNVKGIETLQHLKKVDLRCYPYKAWPHWLKKHPTLETLYITGGDIEGFPKDNLDLPNLQVLRLKYLTHFKLDQDFNNSQLYATLSSLNYLYPQLSELIKMHAT